MEIDEGLISVEGTQVEATESRSSLVRFTFFSLVALAAISLISILFNPLPAVVSLAICSAAAIGIWRGEAWSAYGCALFLLIGVVEAIRQGMNVDLAPGVGPTLIIGVVIESLIISLLFACGHELEGREGRRGAFWPWLILSAGRLAFLIFFQAFTMPTSSMENTLLVGDYFVARKLANPVVSRGDVVVFRFPPNPRQTHVKLAVAIGGDRVYFKNKQLFVNGSEVHEPYVQHSTSYMDAYRDNFPQG